MRRLRGPAERGASTVELALGSLLFVTVLLFGIHFAEVSFLSLKVQEAQNFAIWESTGRRVHQFRATDVMGDPRNIYDPAQQIFNTAELRAETRYVDFDGRRDVNNGGGLTQSLTLASAIDVECQRSNDLDFQVPRGAPTNAWMRDQQNQLRSIYRDTPALQCRARSNLMTIRVPQDFQQDPEGFFRASHVGRSFIPVCGSGRARNGQCRGDATVLLGDWSLDAPLGRGTQNDGVPLSDSRCRDGNRTYCVMVRELFRAGNGSHGDAASDFARVAAQQASPHDETEFYMSYQGAPENYVDGPLPTQQWNTSGVYFRDPSTRAGRNERPKCFLGLGGCR